MYALLDFLQNYKPIHTRGASANQIVTVAFPDEVSFAFLLVQLSITLSFC